MSENTKEIEATENFETQVLQKLDTLANAVADQASRIDKMENAFSLILKDYFKEVIDGVEEFSDFVKEMSDAKSGLAENPRSPEMLRSRLEVLKGKADMVDETTASFSSDQMRQIYKLIMPDIQKSIDDLYKKVESDLGEVVKDLASGQGRILGTMDNYLRTITKNLQEHSRNLSARIASAESGVKSAIPGKGKGFAFQ